MAWQFKWVGQSNNGVQPTGHRRGAHRLIPRPVKNIANEKRGGNEEVMVLVVWA